MEIIAGGVSDIQVEKSYGKSNLRRETDDQVRQEVAQESGREALPWLRNIRSLSWDPKKRLSLSSFVSLLCRREREGLRHKVTHN